MLREKLNFLHVLELKEICAKLALSDKGKKEALVQRISIFIETGDKITSPSYPSISCAKPKTQYDLEENALILKGAYKNDLKTRLFFKKLIGEYFHFTAFGIDWLELRWLEGKPPTYREFAKMWELEYARRKQNPAAPKLEWAYINFLQSHPNASRTEVLAAWEKTRTEHKQYVYNFIDNKYVC